jgi:hypothetical protein
MVASAVAAWPGLDRPAPKQLLADIRDRGNRVRGRVQGGPVEPIPDRFRPHYRSFRKTQRQLRRFFSVTQQFNTTNSFAQGGVPEPVRPCFMF